MSEFLYSSINMGGLTAASAGGSIKNDDLYNLYGSSDDFFKNYETFQKKYIQALRSGKINPSRAGKINLDFLLAGGKIDLSILDEPTLKELKSSYFNDVLKLPLNINDSRMGLPDVELPSTNRYRKAARYSIQFDGSSKGVHPAAVLLNRTIFNINPRVAGIEAFNPGISNLAGMETLRQGVDPIDITGKKVFTFDVETTGVFQNSEVRSMSIAQNIDGNIDLLDDFNFVYKSRQLGGITIRRLRIYK